MVWPLRTLQKSEKPVGDRGASRPPPAIKHREASMTLLRACFAARSRAGASQLLLRASAPTASALMRVPSLAAAPALSAPRRWNQQAPAESHIFDEHDARRRQLLYRSKQRGWLEMDIMLGNWVRDQEVECFALSRLHILPALP